MTPHIISPSASVLALAAVPIDGGCCGVSGVGGGGDSVGGMGVLGVAAGSMGWLLGIWGRDIVHGASVPLAWFLFYLSVPILQSVPFLQKIAFISI